MKKARIRKQKQRQKEKNLISKETEEYLVKETDAIPQIKSKQQKSWQKENGYKLRKAHNKAQSKLIDELKVKIRELEAEKKKSENDLAVEKIKTMNYEETLANLRSQLENCENDMKDKDVWAGEVYSNLSSEGKHEYRKAFTLSVPKLKRGTISRLRKQTGINFSNLVEKKTEDMSEIKTKIVDFAKQNTMEVPDKRKAEKGIRYRNASL